MTPHDVLIKKLDFSKYQTVIDFSKYQTVMSVCQFLFISKSTGLKYAVFPPFISLTHLKTN